MVRVVEANCMAINGDHRGIVFSMKEDVDCKVKVWMQTITKVKPNWFEDVDADEVQLVLAKKDDAWLEWDEAAALATKNEMGYPQGYLRMNPLKSIKDAGYFGENVQLDDAKVHVLVVVPLTTERPEKRQRTDADDSTLNGLDTIAEISQQLSRGDLAEGQVLTIPDTDLDAFFPKGLYIRKEYWVLHDMIMQYVTSDRELRRVLVVGSPGVGKSAFGVFLLLVFMMKKKDVAYRPLAKKLGKAMIFFFTWNDTNGYEISGAPVKGKKYEGLFDGDETGGALGYGLYTHAYVFASPRTNKYNQFVKDACFTVYMNPWTKTECQSFADTILLEDQEEWLRKFNLVGGETKIPVFSI